MADIPNRPEWAPENAGEAFAGRILPAGPAPGRAEGEPVPARRELRAQEYIDGILRGERAMLARAITVIESNAPRHFALSQEIVAGILPHTGRSKRIGITGPPGVGKSTFIEALGTFLCDRGHRVAVLAVDPSSVVSRGSILGDKTRMEKLSRRSEAFIRPSPSGGTLGGVTRKSRETLLLCEAAGFDTVLVETVGVGQSETEVRSMVDFFMVLVITGAGDELQGIKKGVIETADLIMVNKADGDNKLRALSTRAEYEQILHYLRPATLGWQSRAMACSALYGEGIEELWETVGAFMDTVKASGLFEARRKEQTWSWVTQMTERHVKGMILDLPGVREEMARVEEQVLSGALTAATAAGKLIDAIAAAMKR